MLAEERLQAIMRRLEERGTLAVDDVANEFRVSDDTVRRDFNRLARRSEVRRTHGGILLEREVRDSPPADREGHNRLQKEAIAREAASLIQGHETIVLDAGSTTARMVNHITAGDVTIITYSVEIAARAIRRDNLTVYIAGGLVRSTTAAAVGEDTTRMIRSLHAGTAFLGANGLSLEHGVMTPNYHEASVKRAIIDISRRRVLLLDSSKLDRSALVRFGSVEEIDLLVTDAGIDPERRSELEEIVGEVRVVGTQDTPNTVDPVQAESVS